MDKSDLRQHSPAAARNCEPILAVLRAHLPERGLVLEVASGTGEHAVHFARAVPGWAWQPSDPSAAARASIAAWTQSERLANVLPPLDLDAASEDWPIRAADAIVSINMIHIAPWEAAVGLMRGAGRTLHEGAPLVLYGPFRRPGHVLEASNAAFDEDLRRRDSRWGLRALDDVAELATENGLRLVHTVEMPANNLCVVFTRS